MYNEFAGGCQGQCSPEVNICVTVKKFFNKREVTWKNNVRVIMKYIYVKWLPGISLKKFGA